LIHFYKRMICGGTGDVKPADPQVQELVNSLKDDIVKELGGSLGEVEVTHYKTQVVAGTNYFVRVHVGEGRHLHLRIYKHFSGTVKLDGVKEAAAEEPIEHF